METDLLEGLKMAKQKPAIITTSIPTMEEFIEKLQGSKKDKKRLLAKWKIDKAKLTER
jgi:hypothetical protein